MSLDFFPACFTEDIFVEVAENIYFREFCSVSYWYLFFALRFCRHVTHTGGEALNKVNFPIICEVDKIFSVSNYDEEGLL